MWESLNTLYWSIRADDARSRFEESPDDFYRQVMVASMLFQGLADETMPVWQDAEKFGLEVQDASGESRIWRHNGMDSDTAARLQLETLREVR